MTLTWGLDQTSNDISQTHPAAATTPMTDEQRTMLTMWHGITDKKVTAADLAANLIRKFKLEKGKAWILACRFLNEKRG